MCRTARKADKYPLKCLYSPSHHSTLIERDNRNNICPLYLAGIGLNPRQNNDVTCVLPEPILLFEKVCNVCLTCSTTTAPSSRGGAVIVDVGDSCMAEVAPTLLWPLQLQRGQMETRP